MNKESLQICEGSLFIKIIGENFSNFIRIIGVTLHKGEPEMDNELINSCYKRFVAGEKEAFAKIVDEFREGLIYFINRYVNNMDVAEDLSEDVFVELLINPKRYNFTTSLKTYLFTIGRNKAVDYIRKNRRIAGALDEGSAVIILMM